MNNPSIYIGKSNLPVIRYITNIVTTAIPINQKQPELSYLDVLPPPDVFCVDITEERLLVPPLIFRLSYIPVPGIPVFRYVPFLPIFTLAPFGPIVVLTPLRLTLMVTPGAIFMRFLNFQAISL